MSSLRILFFLLFSISTYASTIDPIVFGKVIIGDARVKLDINDFALKLKLELPYQGRVSLKRGSIEWIRIEDILLTPRARIAITLKGKASDYFVKYRNQNILFQDNGKISHTEFYISLYQFEKPEIYYQGNKIGEVEIIGKKKKTNKEAQQIDYSCSRNQVKISGIDHEQISLGCRTHRVGRLGKEKPYTEILWTSPNYEILDHAQAPYIAVFMDSKPVKIKVLDKEKKIKEITISAKIPSRLHRINIAYGLGPYTFETSFKNDTDPLNPIDLQYKEPVAPAFMFYFNYKMTENQSIRGFDAVVWNRSTFNNFGVYFASDVAKPFDQKLTITTLLGMQHLYFKFNKSEKITSEPIFPQGLEVNYRHAFGIENYLIGGGAFLSPSTDYDYQNIWLRFGKDIFWELNYIYWGKEDFSARMFGLSAGFFFGGFL